MIDSKLLYDVLGEVEEEFETTVSEIFKDPSAEDYLYHKGRAEGIISVLKAIIVSESKKEEQSND